MELKVTSPRQPVLAITLLSLLLFFSLPAKAVPVIWTLNGVTFDDGGTASGSFTYDVDTNTYSDIAISTTAGSSRNAASYDALNPGYAGSGPEELVVVSSADGPDFLGDPVFYPMFASPLTNGGGTIAIVINWVEGSCENSACSSAMLPVRSITGGVVTTDATPPASVQQVPTLSVSGLLLTVLGLIAVARKRFDGTDYK